MQGGCLRNAAKQIAIASAFGTLLSLALWYLFARQRPLDANEYEYGTYLRLAALTDHVTTDHVTTDAPPIPHPDSTTIPTGRVDEKNPESEHVSATTTDRPDDEASTAPPQTNSLRVVDTGGSSKVPSKVSANVTDELTYQGRYGRGKTFGREWFSYLEKLKLDADSIGQVNDSDVLASRPVFVTGVSGNHATEVEKLLNTWHEHLGAYNFTFILYDMGVSEASSELTKNYPFIEIVKFNFTEYPEVVRELKHYRFKPLAIAQTLLKHNAVWWMDSSIEWNGTEGFVKALRQMGVTAKLLGQDEEENITASEVDSSFPVHTFIPTDHDIASHTHPGIYEYFPVPRTNFLQLVYMDAATTYLVYATQRAKRDVLKWLVLCALEEDCMAPQGHALYPGADAGPGVHMHRYDQSALTVLLDLADNFSGTHYAPLWKKTLHIHRREDGR